MRLGKSQRDKQINRVSSVALLNDKGELLFMRRRDSGRHTLPGGHAEPGELPAVTAHREVQEETGLKVKGSLQLLGTKTVESKHGKVQVTAYMGLAGPGKPTAEHDPDGEAEAFEWVDVSDGVPKRILENLHSRKNIVLGLMGLQKTEKAYEATGAIFEKVFNGGTRKIKRIDPAKLQQNDYGWYGEGFYVSTSAAYVRAWYGRVVTAFGVDPDATVLLASVDADKAPEGLRVAVLRNEKSLVRARKTATAGWEEPSSDGLDDPMVNGTEWVHAVDRFAEAERYDIVKFSDEEIVVKRLGALKPLDEVVSALQKNQVTDDPLLEHIQEGKPVTIFEHEYVAGHNPRSQMVPGPGVVTKVHTHPEIPGQIYAVSVRDEGNRTHPANVNQLYVREKTAGGGAQWIQALRAVPGRPDLGADPSPRPQQPDMARSDAWARSIDHKALAEYVKTREAWDGIAGSSSSRLIRPFQPGHRTLEHKQHVPNFNADGFETPIVKSDSDLAKVSLNPSEYAKDMEPELSWKNTPVERVESREIRVPGGQKLYHHVATLNQPAGTDFQPVHHTLSTSPDPFEPVGLMASMQGVHGDVQKLREYDLLGSSAPWQDGTAMKVSATAVHPASRGQGLGTLLYHAALSHHSRLCSDQSVSQAATQTWGRLHGLPGVRGALAKPEDVDDVHWAEHTVAPAAPKLTEMHGLTPAQMQKSDPPDYTNAPTWEEHCRLRDEARYHEDRRQGGDPMYLNEGDRVTMNDGPHTDRPARITRLHLLPGADGHEMAYACEAADETGDGSSRFFVRMPGVNSGGWLEHEAPEESRPGLVSMAKQMWDSPQRRLNAYLYTEPGDHEASDNPFRVFGAAPHLFGPGILHMTPFRADWMAKNNPQLLHSDATGGSHELRKNVEDGPAFAERRQAGEFDTIRPGQHVTVTEPVRHIEVHRYHPVTAPHSEFIRDLEVTPEMESVLREGGEDTLLGWLTHHYDRLLENDPLPAPDRSRDNEFLHLTPVTPDGHTLWFNEVDPAFRPRPAVVTEVHHDADHPEQRAYMVHVKGLNGAGDERVFARFPTLQAPSVTKYPPGTAMTPEIYRDSVQQRWRELVDHGDNPYPLDPVRLARHVRGLDQSARHPFLGFHRNPPASFGPHTLGTGKTAMQGLDMPAEGFARGEPGNIGTTASTLDHTPYVPKDDEIAKALVKSEYLDDEVARLLRHPDLNERTMALKLPTVTPAHLVLALRDVPTVWQAHMSLRPRDMLVTAVLKHPLANREVLARAVDEAYQDPEMAQHWGPIAGHPEFDSNLAQRMMAIADRDPEDERYTQGLWHAWHHSHIVDEGKNLRAPNLSFQEAVELGAKMSTYEEDRQHRVKQRQAGDPMELQPGTRVHITEGDHNRSVPALVTGTEEDAPPSDLRSSEVGMCGPCTSCQDDLSAGGLGDEGFPGGLRPYGARPGAGGAGTGQGLLAPAWPYTRDLLRHRDGATVTQDPRYGTSSKRVPERQPYWVNGNFGAPRLYMTPHQASNKDVAKTEAFHEDLGDWLAKTLPETHLEAISAGNVQEEGSNQLQKSAEDVAQRSLAIELTPEDHQDFYRLVSRANAALPPEVHPRKLRVVVSPLVKPLLHQDEERVMDAPALEFRDGRMARTVQPVKVGVGANSSRYHAFVDLPKEDKQGWLALDRAGWIRGEPLGRFHLPLAMRKSEEPLSKAFTTKKQLLRLSWRRPLDRAVQAAEFLSGSVAPHQALQEASWAHEGDPVQAALVAHRLPVTPETRQSVQAVEKLQAGPHQGWHEPPKSWITDAKDIQPALEEGRPVAEAVLRALQLGKIQPVSLGGKYSGETALATDPEGKVWLLKPGTSTAGPEAGVQEETASQSQREAAFAHVAKDWGLQDDVPQGELLLIDGKQVAALHFLPQASWEQLEKLREEDAGGPARILEPYRQSGRLFMWAVLDFVLGSSDRHLGNVLVNPDEGKIALIDAGNALAGPDFDPAHDRKSFVPCYLRPNAAPNFNQLPLGRKLASMVLSTDQGRKALGSWLKTLDEGRLELTLVRYGVNPAASVDRLRTVKGLQQPLDGAVNKLWITT